MTDKPKVLEINVQNGTEIERDFTDKELAELKLRDVETQAMLDDMLRKAEARKSALAKLGALGLTQDEIAAL
jgi:hypothetical protein